MAEYYSAGLHEQDDSVDPFKPSLAFSLNNVFPNRARHGFEREPQRQSLYDPPQDTSYGPQYQTAPLGYGDHAHPAPYQDGYNSYSHPPNADFHQHRSHTNRYNYADPYDSYAHRSDSSSRSRSRSWTRHRHRSTSGTPGYPIYEPISSPLRSRPPFVTRRHSFYGPPFPYPQRRSRSRSRPRPRRGRSSSLRPIGLHAYRSPSPQHRRSHHRWSYSSPPHPRRAHTYSLSPPRRSYAYSPHHRRHFHGVPPRRHRSPSLSSSRRRSPSPTRVIYIHGGPGPLPVPQPPPIYPFVPNLPPRLVRRSGFVGSHTVGDYILAFLRDTVPRQIYRHLLLRLPDLYYSRVKRIFDDADMSMPIIKQGILDTAKAKQQVAGYGSGMGMNTGYLPRSIWEQPQSIASTRLEGTWDSFINSLQREWETLNIISVLLLTAILTILQIPSAAADPIIRYSALLSMICALMSLLYGCIFIIRFGTLRKTYKGAEWSQQTKSLRVGIFWNVWVFLAMPATWLAWSMILYIVAIMSFVWRTTPVSSPNAVDESFVQIIIPRIILSLVVGLGVIYFVLIASTLRTYGEMMDRAWQKRIWGWMNDGIRTGYGIRQPYVPYTVGGQGHGIRQPYVPHTTGGQGHGMANMPPPTAYPPRQGYSYTGAYGGYDDYPSRSFRQPRRHRRSGGVRFNSRGRANTFGRHRHRTPSVRTVDSEKGSSSTSVSSDSTGVSSSTAESVNPTLLQGSDHLGDVPQKSPSMEIEVEKSEDRRRRAASLNLRSRSKEREVEAHPRSTADSPEHI